MKPFFTLVFIGIGSASLVAESSSVFLVGRDIGGLMARGSCGVGATCEAACGAGWQTCIHDPYCWNPSIHVCCSNAGVCDKGEYCGTTTLGKVVCCKNGVSLEDCGAVATVSTIGPTKAATKQPSESTGHSQAPPVSTASIVPPAPTAATEPSTVPTPLPPVVTAGGGKKAEIGTLAIVGIVALLLAV